MKWLTRSITAFTIGIITTAVVVVAGFIILMFTSGEGTGRYEGLFGGIFFEARETAQGSLQAGVGLGEPLPIVLLMVISIAFWFGVVAMYGRLKQRREELLNHA